MAVNRGKQFEQQIKESFLNCDEPISIDRLPDPSAGYAGVKNICDFIVYSYPHEYYIECKSVHGNTLNFSNITDNQWNGLQEKSQIWGVVAGVIVWFIDRDLTAYVPIQELVRLKDEGCKSLNIKHITMETVEHTIIPGKKKRVLFEYKITKELLLEMGGRFRGKRR